MWPVLHKHSETHTETAHRGPWQSRVPGNVGSPRPGGKDRPNPWGSSSFPASLTPPWPQSSQRGPGGTGHGALLALREPGAPEPGLSPPPPPRTLFGVRLPHFLSHLGRRASSSAGLLTLPCSAHPGPVLPCPPPGCGVEADESPGRWHTQRHSARK